MRLNSCVRWLLSALLLVGVAPVAAYGQLPARARPAPRKAAPKPKPRPAPAGRVAKPDYARIVSVRDSSSPGFVVPQVLLTDTVVAARINLVLVEAALAEDLQAVPQPLTARAAIRQAQLELAASSNSGLVGARYEVLYNTHHLLSVETTAEYLGAYPFSFTRHATFDLRTGQLLQVRDLVADTLALRQRWQQSINRRVAAHLRALPTDYPLLDADMLTDVQRRLFWTDSTATVQLDAEEPRFYDFALTPFGLVLYYDFGFPHLMQALQPDTDYLFSYADLKLWLKPKGALAFQL